jgi:hypothetical protein
MTDMAGHSTQALLVQALQKAVNELDFNDKIL